MVYGFYEGITDVVFYVVIIKFEEGEHFPYMCVDLKNYIRAKKHFRVALDSSLFYAQNGDDSLTFKIFDILRNAVSGAFVFVVLLVEERRLQFTPKIVSR